MKDFNFKNGNRSVNVTYRTDLIGTEGNFTVMQVTGLNEFSLLNVYDQKRLSVAFKQLPYSVAAFKTLAGVLGLELTMSDSNGSNSVVLVVGDDSDQDSDS